MVCTKQCKKNDKVCQVNNRPKLVTGYRLANPKRDELKDGFITDLAGDVYNPTNTIAVHTLVEPRMRYAKACHSDLL